MANYLPSHTTIQIGESLMKIVKLYDRGGLIVKLIMMDMEFKKKVGLVEVNTTVVREHVAENERQIRLSKERTRPQQIYLSVVSSTYISKLLSI